jgi:hypothetical protein
MDQQALDAAEPIDKPPSTERREPPPPALIPGWRCFERAEFRAEGETGFVDLAALHVRRGVALVAMLEPNEEASPEEARAAFRAMLQEAEFDKRFPGELPVVALAIRRADAEQLAASVERAFASLTPPSVAEDWVDWLGERLSPPAEPALPQPRLVAPPREDIAPEAPPEASGLAPLRDEAPPVDAAPPVLVSAEPPLLAPLRDEAPPADAALPVLVPAEAPPSSAALQARTWLDWGGSLGFALGIVLALLFGLVLLSHGGRPF